MKIDSLMDIQELAQHMGTKDLAEAKRMRELLLEEGRERTEDFSGQEWVELMLQASGAKTVK